MKYEEQAERQCGHSPWREAGRRHGPQLPERANHLAGSGSMGGNLSKTNPPRHAPALCPGIHVFLSCEAKTFEWPRHLSKNALRAFARQKKKKLTFRNAPISAAASTAAGVEAVTQAAVPGRRSNYVAEMALSLRSTGPSS